MSVNISHFLALTPHKLCEFLEIFKNIFQGPYLVKKEPISFWANMIWDFDLFSPTSKLCEVHMCDESSAR